MPTLGAKRALIDPLVLARLWAAGATDAELAAHFRSSLSGARRARRRLGLASKHTPGLTPEQVDAIGAMLDDGASVAEVERTLGHDHETVARYFPGRVWTPEERVAYQRTLRGWDDVHAANYVAETRSVGEFRGSFNTPAYSAQRAA